MDAGEKIGSIGRSGRHIAYVVTVKAIEAKAKNAD